MLGQDSPSGSLLCIFCTAFLQPSGRVQYVHILLTLSCIVYKDVHHRISCYRYELVINTVLRYRECYPPSAGKTGKLRSVCGFKLPGMSFHSCLYIGSAVRRRSGLHCAFNLKLDAGQAWMCTIASCACSSTLKAPIYAFLWCETFFETTLKDVAQIRQRRYRIK